MVASLAVVGAALMAAYLMRERGRSTTAPGPSGAGASAACGSGQNGPLRTDGQFTANDAAGTLVRYSVSLPDDYWTACKHYPVLYALHGKAQDNVTFLAAALSMRRAMTAGVLEQAIIVTPDSYATGRWEDRDTGPAETNFITHLIPHVEQNYRVKGGPSYRLLAGFSMGGHGAFRFGLKYPQMFAAVWSVDGAMADPKDYLPLVEASTTADLHIICVGGRLNGDRVQALVAALKGRGIDIPHVYQDVDHDFVTFVREDEKAGWFAMKFLQSNLGRAI